MPALSPDAAQTEMMRSWLFVPADDERKLSKAEDCAADAVIVDLEDAVAESARNGARQLAADFIRGKTNTWVRINPLDTKDAVVDLEAVVASAPAGIVLPKPKSADDVRRLETMLDAMEAEASLDAGAISILPLCTERPEALFSLHGYTGVSERLRGLSWGAEDLSAALGASTNRDADGNWLPVYEMARSFCLLAAAAAEVAAIDTVFTHFRDEAGLLRYAGNARRDGFSGMLAIHPAQVAVINAAFTPTAEERERAAKIVALFENNPGAGVLSLDGVMLDKPHYVQARRVLDIARE